MIPLIANYYSESMLTQFQKSSYLFIDPGANISIRIESKPHDLLPENKNAFFVAACLSLGIIPAIGSSDGYVSFLLTDTSADRVVARYKYPVSHRYFAGLLAPVALSVAPFTDRVDFSSDRSTTAIAELAVSRFEADLRADLLADEALADRFTSGRPPAYAVMPVEIEGGGASRGSPALRSALESALLRGGLKLAERERLAGLLKELEYSASGLTLAQGVEIGQHIQADRLIFASIQEIRPPSRAQTGRVRALVKCVEVRSRRILWSESVYEVGRTSDESVEAIVDRLSLRLISRLRDRGMI